MYFLLKFWEKYCENRWQNYIYTFFFFFNRIWNCCRWYLFHIYDFVDENKSFCGVNETNGNFNIEVLKKCTCAVKIKYHFVGVDFYSRVIFSSPVLTRWLWDGKRCHGWKRWVMGLKRVLTFGHKNLNWISGVN